MIWDSLTVFVVSLVAGAWALPVGLLVGLPALAVYLLAVAGGMVQAGALLVGGGRARRWITARLPDAEDRVSRTRAADIVERWGAPGLATIGATVLGPTATVLAAVVLGVERRRFFAWYTAGTIVGYALLLWLWTAVA